MVTKLLGVRHGIIKPGARLQVGKPSKGIFVKEMKE